MAGWNFRVSNRNKWEVRMEGKTSRLPKPRRFRMRRKPNKLGEWRSVVSKWEFVMSPRATVISSCRCLLNSVADIEDLTKGQYLYKVRSKKFRGNSHNHILFFPFFVHKFCCCNSNPLTMIVCSILLGIKLYKRKFWIDTNKLRNADTGIISSYLYAILAEKRNRLVNSESEMKSEVKGLKAPKALNCCESRISSRTLNGAVCWRICVCVHVRYIPWVWY